ncbi:hypothetical protein Mycsm_03602 [Mycobacterium sp. JS623]|nr:hypothetical protein Mycsm_03602 [Mycobacterium sp. JS623]
MTGRRRRGYRRWEAMFVRVGPSENTEAELALSYGARLWPSALPGLLPRHNRFICSSRIM